MRNGDATSRAPEVLSLTSVGELKDVAAEWLALAQRLRGSSYFQTPDWVLNWWESIAARPPTEIAVWRDRAGALEAIVSVSQSPWQLAKRPPLVANVWANSGFGSGADHGGWPVLPRRVEDVRTWLVRRTAGTTLMLVGMDPETGVPLLPPGAHRVARYTCPRIEFNSMDDVPDSSGPSHKRLAKKKKELMRKGVTFRWIPPGRMDDRVLESLWSLHEARFRMKGVPTLFTRDRMELHRRLIACSAPDRGPCALIAESGGRPIAVHYGFWWRNVYSMCQSGWDPSWAKASLGTVALGELIRCVRSEGARVFDFLHGAGADKYYFGATDRWDETWIVPRGITGRILRLKSLAQAQLQQPWARPLARLSERVRWPAGGG